MIPWRQAWQEALYGPEGFYRRPEGPAGHFTTPASHTGTGRLLVEAIAALADAERLCGVVDVGCGRGELLGRLRTLRPDLELTGVDVAERPRALPRDIGWLRSPGGAMLCDSLQDLTDVLVVAHEWLDVVPCPVAEVDADGVLSSVLVDPATGHESLRPGGLTAAELAWVDRWWPAAGMPPGTRVEIGLGRDLAWSGLLERIRTGVAVAVDYGHTVGDRPRQGTLTAYREGRLVNPVPDGTRDLTAHVAVDSLDHDEIWSQRAALDRLGVSAPVPERSSATADPAGYLAALARRSALVTLRDPSALGGFSWVVRRIR